MTLQSLLVLVFVIGIMFMYETWTGKSTLPVKIISTVIYLAVMNFFLYLALGISGS